MINFPVAQVNTLSPVRTFWEKATLIHVECHRNRSTQSPERLSRHWYDLYLLANSWVEIEAFKAVDIFLSVIEHKKAFFNASYANYDHCIEGNFKLCPGGDAQHALNQDFNAMVDAGMFNQTPPKFSTIMQSLAELEKKINSELSIIA